VSGKEEPSLEEGSGRLLDSGPPPVRKYAEEFMLWEACVVGEACRFGETDASLHSVVNAFETRLCVLGRGAER
jgi:hypothetical protein